LLFNLGMATSKELRVANLRLLVKEFKTADAVAQRAETAPMYLSQILNGVPSSTGKPRGVGDALARRLERGCGKSVGWLDKDHSVPAAVGGVSADASKLTKEELRVLAVYRRASQIDPIAKAVLDDALTMAQGLLDEATFRQDQG
jgi:hypothetical protein